MKTVRLSKEYQVHCFKEQSSRFKSLERIFYVELYDMGWIGIGVEYELLLSIYAKSLKNVIYIGNIDETKNHKYPKTYLIDDWENTIGLLKLPSEKRKKTRVVDFNNVLKEIGISLEDLKSVCEDYEWIIIEKI